MSKIFSIAFFLSILVSFGISNSYANSYLEIISREKWGANEQFRYWNSSYWSNIFKDRERASKEWNKQWNSFSEEKRSSIHTKNQKRAAKTKEMNGYLVNNFYNDIKIISNQRYEGKNKLAWAIQKTNTVKNIVIHHTHSEYKDSYTGIQQIYKYHSLSRQWGDIGYHYIIGYGGEIFEGKAGGDYVIGSHDSWNNRSTVGIAIMGNYETKHLNQAQYESLKKLSLHLVNKYGIDLNKKVPYHKECFGDTCTQPLQTQYYYPIVGHKDGKETSCPGDHIYNEIIPKLLKELQPKTKGNISIKYDEIKKEKEAFQQKLDSFPWEKLRNKFSKLTRKKQVLLYSKVQNLNKYEHHWKRKLILQKFLQEIRL